MGSRWEEREDKRRGIWKASYTVRIVECTELDGIS